jgi:tRNA G37 N-methylase TrmD
MRIGGKVGAMARENVRFDAIKTVKKPTTVKFKTKSGKTVSFKAVKTLSKRESVHFRAKRK